MNACPCQWCKLEGRASDLCFTRHALEKAQPGADSIALDAKRQALLLERIALTLASIHVKMLGVFR